MMYSVTPFYNSVRPFDSNVTQTSMYPMKPYYSFIQMDNQQQQILLTNNNLPSGPLPIPKDLDLEKDHDARMALEDLLSRQMLLFCRLNVLERQLIDDNDINIIKSNKSNDLKLIKSTFEKNIEDIVIKFDLDNPPIKLLTVLNFMQKNSPELFLINYHIHSSLFTDDDYSTTTKRSMNLMIKQIEIKQKLLNEKLEKINFHFNTIKDNCERIKRKIIITFIAKKFQTNDNNNKIELLIYKSNESTIINDELMIIEYFYKLMNNDDDDNDVKNLSIDLLKQLQSKQSECDCIEKFGHCFIGISDKKFLFNQTKPHLIDIIVWSLANNNYDDDDNNNNNNSLITLRSLLDIKWFRFIESLLF